MKLQKNINSKGFLQNVIHPKGWGWEIWVENCDQYCGKILCFYKGKKTSLHHHVNKLETMHLISGKINIELREPVTGEKYVVELCVGDSIQIPPGHSHQIVALEESELLEFSTKHEDSDSYRVEKGD